MAVSSAAELLTLHVQLRSNTERLLELARSEHWDDLPPALKAHQELEQRVHVAYQEMRAVTAQERTALQEHVDAIVLMSDELVERLSLQQAEVGNLLEDIRLTRVNGRRLRQHYGG